MTREENTRGNEEVAGILHVGNAEGGRHSLPHCFPVSVGVAGQQIGPSCELRIMRTTDERLADPVILVIF